MKKLLANRIVFFAFIICLLPSCISMQGMEMTPEEGTFKKVLGNVTTQWVRYNFLNIPPTDKRIETKAETRLRIAARLKGYNQNFEIKNISVQGHFNGLTLIQIIPMFALMGNFQTVVASGDVVVSLADAVKNTSAQIIELLPENSTLAVLNIYSDNAATSEYIISNLEYNLVNSGKFRMVDRRRLDQISSVQNFQLSGELNSASAVSIGNTLGANIVIIGELTGTGLLTQLTLRALDVKTTEILSVARSNL